MSIFQTNELKFEHSWMSTVVQNPLDHMGSTVEINIEPWWANVTVH